METPDRRLRPRDRLRASAEFQEVFRSGRAIPGRWLVLHVLSATGLQRKAGFVAGRRVGGAVERNRAKRLLREAYRHVKDRVPREGCHLVLVARASCSRARMGDVEAELVRLLGVAGIFGESER